MEHLSSEEILIPISQLEEEPKRVIFHLLSCVRCRAKALSLVEDETDPELPLPDPLWARVHHAMESRRWEIERDRVAAGRLYDELIEHPPEGRTGVVAAEPRFHSPGLVRLLFAASEETKDADPDRAEPLARLALEIAQALPERVGELTRVELRTDAWCRVADLRRMRGDFKEAGKAFRRAAHQLAAESLDGMGRAVLCRFLARLRKDQGRLDEALALYGRAAVLFDSMEAFETLSETLVEEAWLRQQELDPESARSIFQVALGMIDSKLRPHAALSARHGLALCCAELGRPAEAEEILAEGREVVDRLSRPTDRLRDLWIEAQVLERGGDFRKAAEVLWRVITGLMAEGAVYDAALAALELAGLYIELGSRGELERLRREIAPLSALSNRHRAAWQTLSFALAYAVQGDRNSALFLENAAQYLTRVRHDPDLRFHPSLKPLTEIDWDHLGPALRRQLCIQAGLSADLAERLAAEIEEPLQRQISRALEALTGLRVVFFPAPGG